MLLSAWMPHPNCFWISFMEMQASSAASILGSIFICCFNLGFHLSTTLCSLFFPVNHFFQSSYLLTFLQLFTVLIVLVLIAISDFVSFLTSNSGSILSCDWYLLLWLPLNFKMPSSILTFHSKSSIQVLSTNP